jgi:hypothetical protein
MRKKQIQTILTMTTTAMMMTTITTFANKLKQSIWFPPNLSKIASYGLAREG